MTSRRGAMLAVMLLLVASLALTDAGQNLRKTTCPLCDMDIRPEIKAPILGNQFVYACEMAGHIDQLQNEPKSNLGAPKQVDISKDVVYKDATDISCPVCGKGFSELKYAVPWISLGDQKIYTCSEEHAHEVFANPTKFIGSGETVGGFCNQGSALVPRGSVMFNGFQLAIGKEATCALLLFKPWILTSAVKYAFAFLGVVLLAMSMEGLGVFRDSVEERLYRQYGVVYSSADYHEVKSPSSGTSLKAVESTALNAKGVMMMRRIPFWCKVVLACFYMVNLTIAYWLMLIIMMFETLFFVAVILGLGLGFFIFKDTEADKMSGNIDPCCST
ncbi:hypothetical protein Poli38472_005106 [Pythium oligandrum]|uniref:Copper transport protein n=1 Tax=Pythium oligandrum TaxID=41045 RepID=A0A8K1FLA8_PYTOL|nr:hypothetical protein Poli38472_005106 [Pythium oligandrum]|eukprot:TMW62488.1 hypothetical protein Poli38472_005106 [Pythium oligandrum]